MDDELNRFVEQKQKEVFVKTDVCTMCSGKYNHDSCDINLVYFGVLIRKLLHTILTFNSIEKTHV